MAIKDGRITWIGNDNEASVLFSEADEVDQVKVLEPWITGEKVYEMN